MKSYVDIPRPLRFSLPFFSSLLLGACTIPLQDGEQSKTLVIGFGIVSTDSRKDEIRVVDLKALGFTFSNLMGPNASLGYIDRNSIAVDLDSNVIIDYDQRTETLMIGSQPIVNP